MGFGSRIWKASWGKDPSQWESLTWGPHYAIFHGKRKNKEILRCQSLKPSGTIPVDNWATHQTLSQLRHVGRNCLKKSTNGKLLCCDTNLSRLQAKALDFPLFTFQHGTTTKWHPTGLTCNTTPLIARKPQCRDFEWTKNIPVGIPLLTWTPAFFMQKTAVHLALLKWHI